MTTGKDLTVQNNEVTAFDLPSEETLTRQIEAINRFQSLVHKFMVEGQDYGTIPGTNKPSLLKPGAEKITKLLSLADTYDVIDRVEDWQKPLFRYMVKCTLSFREQVVSEGMGECNSLESKYRWRDVKPKCPKCGRETIIKGKAEYGGGWVCFKKKGGCGQTWPDGATEIEGQPMGKVPNDEIFSLINTILKMAEKRALVDAALHAGRLSNVFTQDVEDLAANDVITEQPKAEPIRSEPKLEKNAKGKDAEKAEAPPPDAKVKGEGIPLTPIAIYNFLVKLTESKTITQAQAKQKVVDLGGEGKNTWVMVESLQPDKLAELHKWVEGKMTKPIFEEPAGDT